MLCLADVSIVPCTNHTAAYALFCCQLDPDAFQSSSPHEWGLLMLSFCFVNMCPCRRSGSALPRRSCCLHKCVSHSARKSAARCLASSRHCPAGGGPEPLCVHVCGRPLRPLHAPAGGTLLGGLDLPVRQAGCQLLPPVPRERVPVPEAEPGWQPAAAAGHPGGQGAAPGLPLCQYGPRHTSCSSAVLLSHPAMQQISL